VAFDGLPVVSPLASEAVIRWRTNLPSDSKVRYGNTCDALGQEATDERQTSAHSVTLVGLSPLTEYCYQAQSSNGATTTIWSNPQTFTTLKEEVRVALPAIVLDAEP
jgi:hypothetical protein